MGPRHAEKDTGFDEKMARILIASPRSMFRATHGDHDPTALGVSGGDPTVSPRHIGTVTPGQAIAVLCVDEAGSVR